MLDIKLLRKDPVTTESRLRTKDPGVSLAPILDLDEQVRATKTEVEQLKSRRNALSSQIGAFKTKQQHPTALLEEVADIGDKIAAYDRILTTLEDNLSRHLSVLPNFPMEDLPIAPDSTGNVIIRQWGEKPVFDFAFKNHVELNEHLHLFDFPRAAKISGSGWPAYRGMGARLEWALINYMLDTHIANGFTMWIPPLLVRPEIMFGSGQLPKFETQQFKISDDDYSLYLIPTSETALNGLHADEILLAEHLPLRYCAYTPCFRREAGAAGSQERGLIRTHQFNKVEMFAFALPEESQGIFDEMVAHAEALLQGLGLHFRSMLLSTGDMAFSAMRTVDIEVWLPGQNRYYEVSSVSNCGDFQARRSQIRYRAKGEKPELLHTLNGSGLATSRLMVALLENYQNPDGTVDIPLVLQKYVGGIPRLTPASP